MMIKSAREMGIKMRISLCHLYILNEMMLESKGLLPPLIPDYSALRASQSSKHSQSSHFSGGKWLLSVILPGPAGLFTSQNSISSGGCCKIPTDTCNPL